MKKFLNKNAIWDVYVKLSVIVSVINALISGAYIAWFFGLPQRAFKKIKSIFHR